MITTFMEEDDPLAMMQMREKIYIEVVQLPMKAADRKAVDDAIQVWNQNCDLYIGDTENEDIRASVMADFNTILGTVDASLLRN